MGGSTQTTNSQQQTTQQPWTPAIPGLQQVLSDATNLYDSGTGDGVYSGQRVAQLGSDSLAGLQMARDQASSDNAGALGTSALQNILGSNGISSTTAQGLGMLSSVPNVSAQSVLGQSGLNSNGLSSGSMSALSQLGNVKGVDLSGLSSLSSLIGSASNPINQTASSFMSGAQNLTTLPQLQDLYTKSQAPSAAETNLSGMAAGQDLDPTTNPYMQALVNTSNQNAANATKEAFAASGRYGSGSFAGATTKAINDTDTALYANQYNQNLANQLSANSQIDAARQAASQLGSGIVSQIGNVENTNNQNLLAGAQLGQGQESAEAGVLGQLMSGGEFNSNLGLQQAQDALSTYAQGTSNRLGALTTDASNDLNSQEFNSNLGVTQANGYINAGQTGQAQALQAASELPALDALRYTPSQIESNVGSVLQNQDQNNINAAMDYYNQTQQEPWNYLSQYAGIMGGIGGMGSEGTSIGHSTTQTSQSLGSSLLGGALGIGGLVSKLAGAGLF